MEELDYIINFCEQNLQIKSDVGVDDEEGRELEKLKLIAENFAHMQYYLIIEKYKTYCDKITQLLNGEDTDLVGSEGMYKYLILGRFC